MPKTTKLRVPSYRRHKPTGQAVVTLDGRDIYLGKHNTAASRQEYRLIAEWLAGGCRHPAKPAAETTIAELLAAFLAHAKGYHSEDRQDHFKLAMRPLKELYGRTPVADFGPLALKAVRLSMIESDLARITINDRVNSIRHIFKWGVENEIVPPNVLHGLQAVSGLRRGRTEARETEPVKPVPEAFVDAVLPYVSGQVAAMIELQRITGMRSGEVTAMRGCDINTAGKVWTFTPEAHKTAWHGHARTVYLGPRAQEIIKPFLKADTAAYLFSPADAEAERNERRFGVCSAGRTTKVYPSELRGRERRRNQRAKRARKRRRGPRDRYDTASYRRAVSRSVEIANKALLADAEAAGLDADTVALVPNWHPHQLRHNAATSLRKEHGIEIARIILGHRSAAITEVYAEVDHTRAIEVMGKIG